MNSFEDFMNEAEKSSDQIMPNSDISISSVQVGLATAINGILTPLSIPSVEQQKFSEEVSKLVQDKVFLTELSGQIGKPLDNESEDDFVMRSNDKLRKILYKRFNVKYTSLICNVIKQLTESRNVVLLFLSNDLKRTNFFRYSLWSI